MRANFSKVFSVMGRLVLRWLECLGENPPLSRDHGLHAWRYLHPPRRCDQVAPHTAVHLMPVRHLYLVPGESAPGVERGDLLGLLAEEAEFPRGEMRTSRYSPGHAP